jgi:hypothetical protein
MNEEMERLNFERMARVKYPTALAQGRHPRFGTYNNSGLRKRWEGWMDRANWEVAS